MSTSSIMLHSNTASRRAPGLSRVGERLRFAAQYVVLLLKGKIEPEPPRHLARTIALLRRAEELEKTDPEAAAKVRWLACSYCSI